jgi:hypothetical protein
MGPWIKKAFAPKVMTDQCTSTERIFLWVPLIPIARGEPSLKKRIEDVPEA